MFVFVADCPAGSFSTPINRTCILCPRGTYQPSRGRLSCLPCGQNLTTTSAGTVDKIQCFSRFKGILLGLFKWISFFSFFSYGSLVLSLVSNQKKYLRWVRGAWPSTTTRLVNQWEMELVLRSMRWTFRFCQLVDRTVDGLKSCFFDRYPFVWENSRPRILTQKLPPVLITSP